MWYACITTVGLKVRQIRGYTYARAVLSPWDKLSASTIEERAPLTNFLTGVLAERIAMEFTYQLRNEPKS